MVFPAIILLVALLSYGCALDDNVPQNTATPITVNSAIPIKITAQQLGQSYSLIGGNPKTADGKYENKTLTITGKTWLIFNDGTGRMAFKTNGNAIGVTCWFKDEGAAISHVQEGQTVTVTGTCDGLGAEVDIEDCTLDNVQPLPVIRNVGHRHEHHRVIYKVGEYPYRPDWMTQKQWDSYIDWESQHISN